MISLCLILWHPATRFHKLSIFAALVCGMSILNVNLLCGKFIQEFKEERKEECFAFLVFCCDVSYDQCNWRCEPIYTIFWLRFKFSPYLCTHTVYKKQNHKLLILKYRKPLLFCKHEKYKAWWRNPRYLSGGSFSSPYLTLPVHIIGKSRTK